jgi:hypothetical protein
MNLNSATALDPVFQFLDQSPSGPAEWSAEAITVMLRQAAAIKSDDGFEFAIGDPTLGLDAALYGGARFPVDAQMAGRRFAQFHLDVSSGDVFREPCEILEGRNWFGFAGLSRARVPAVSRADARSSVLH